MKDNARSAHDAAIGRLTALVHGDVRFAPELANDAPAALASVGIPSPDTRPIVAVTTGHAPSGLVIVPWVTRTTLAAPVREATEAVLELEPAAALAACSASFDPRSTCASRFLVVGTNPIPDCAEDLISPPAQGGAAFWNMCAGRTNLDRLAAVDGHAQDLMLLPGAEVRADDGFDVVRHGCRIARCGGQATRRLLEDAADDDARTNHSLTARAARARLASRTILVARPQSRVPAILRWALAGASPTLAERTIRIESIHVRSLEKGTRALAKGVAQIARQYGIETVASPAGARTLCIATDDLASTSAHELARGLHATKRAWILVFWRTPYLVIAQGGPQGRPCLECLTRTVLDGPMGVAIEKTKRGTGPVVTGDTATQIGRKIARALSGVESPGAMSAITLGHSPSMRTEHLAARPDCPVCGRPGLRQAITEGRRLRKVDIAEEAMQEGSYPQSVTQRLFELGPRLAAPWTGRWVNYRARRFTGDPRERFLHQGLAECGVLPGSNPATNPIVPSSGKGQTHRQACAAAMGEAVQARAAHFKRGLQRGIEIKSELEIRDHGFAVVTPAEIGRFSTRQHEHATCIGLLFRRKAYAPKGYTEEERRQERRWMQGRDLTTDEPVYVPAESCLRSVPDPSPTMVPGLRAGSAAGPSRLHAAIAAIHERIERDALSMWWVTHRPCPRIDLASADDRWINGVTETFAAHGRSILALDITTTPKAPTVLSISALLEPRGDASVERIVRAATASTLIRALKAAIAENVQALPDSTHGDAFPGVDPTWAEVVAWRRMGKDGPPWLEGVGVQTLPLLGEERVEERNPVAAYESALEAASDAGAQRVIGADLTEPGDPLATVAVVTPGLRSQLIEAGTGRYDRLHPWSRPQDRALSQDELTTLGMVL